MELSELLVKGDELNLLLLQTNHDSSHLFSDYIRDGTIPTTDAQTSADQNITDAIRESEAFVVRWAESGKSLVDLIGVIRNRLWAIFHSVEDEGLVYRVFEVLNSRGLDVSWIDKLKSQLMGTSDRRATRPIDPPCPYPGNERRKLPPRSVQETRPPRKSLAATFKGHAFRSTRVMHFHSGLTT